MIASLIYGTDFISYSKVSSYNDNEKRYYENNTFRTRW